MAEHRATAEENARATDFKKKKHKRRAAPPASEQSPGWLNLPSYLVGHNLPEVTVTQKVGGTLNYTAVTVLTQRI
jgi:hypothetical protein